MNHTVNFIGQTNKQTKFGNVLDFAFDNRSDRMFFNICSPRVRSALFDAEADSSLFRINFENFNFNFLRSRNDFTRMNIFACPAHFGNVNQTFDTVFKFNKCAVIGDVGNLTGVNIIYFVFVCNILPRIFFKLLHAERNTLVVFIELNNLNFNGLTDGQNFARVINAFPRNVGNFQPLMLLSPPKSKST